MLPSPVNEQAFFEAKLAMAKQRSATTSEYERYRDDLAGYIREVLKGQPWIRQEEIAKSVQENKRTLVRTGHGIGKSWVAAAIVNAWFDSRPKSVVVTTAPTFRQVTAVLWREIRSQRTTKPSADIFQIRDPLNPAHYAMGYTTAKNVRADAHEAQSAQGIHAQDLLAVLDEAGGVHPAVWQAFDGMAVGAGNHILAIGNPTVNSGPFFEAARSGRWNVISVPVFEHPNIVAALEGKPEPIPGAVSLDWLEGKLADPRWVEEIDPEIVAVDGVQCFEFRGRTYKARPIAQSLILGQFPSDVVDTVWALAWVEAARNRELKWSVTDPIEIGVDVARFGADNSAFHARRGPCSLLHRSWAHEDSVSTAGRVHRLALDLAAEHSAPELVVRVDTTGGHGSGPVDVLNQLFYGLENVRVEEINSSEPARDIEHFPTLRSELWFATADRASDGRLDFSRLGDAEYESLLAELTAPKFKYDARGRKVVEAKDDVKKWLKRSPDDADAMNLAYYGTPSTDAPSIPVDDIAGASRWLRSADAGISGGDWGTSAPGAGSGWDPW